MTLTFQPMTRTMNPSKVVVSDIEGDNLLYDLSRFHCGVNINPFTLEETLYVPDQSTEYLKALDLQECVIGHNFGGFDLLALDKLFGYKLPGFCFDTLVLSRLLDPEKKSHSLETWGRKFKFFKGDYKVAFKARMGEKYQPGMEWWEFNQEMMDYCVQDVRLNALIFLWMIQKLGWFSWFDVTKADCVRLEKAIREGDLKRT